MELTTVIKKIGGNVIKCNVITTTRTEMLQKIDDNSNNKKCDKFVFNQLQKCNLKISF